jgi:hypothetical protein
VRGIARAALGRKARDTKAEIDLLLIQKLIEETEK